MSGHSKWSQIKRQKGAADVKRGAVFSRLTNAIILAAKNGSDPAANFTLKMAIEKAKQENMPKENIERAIARGSGKSGGLEIAEVLYEIIAPHSIGIIVLAATDNKNRTTSEIKNAAGKFSAKLASSGAVTYQFQKMGKIIIESNDQNKDELELQIIDAGAEDILDTNEGIIVFTKPHELERVKKNLESQNITIKEAALSYEPQNIVHLSENEAEGIIKLIDALENLNDVSEVYSNFDLISN